MNAFNIYPSIREVKNYPDHKDAEDKKISDNPQTLITMTESKTHMIVQLDYTSSTIENSIPE